MDNITHSLTSALAAKIIETRTAGAELDRPKRRTIFWLLVICANLPDIDVVSRFLEEPLYPLQFHRGITHSLVFAPFFALLPAGLFYLLGKVKDFRILWLVSLIGIVLHIFFDLITAFGTQIFAPLSTTRYSLDWMFIIDPIFTGILTFTLLGGKFFARYKKRIVLTGGIVIVLYILTEMVSHSIAYSRLETQVRREGIVPTKVSVLAQPLSVFRWMGLVQTDQEIMQTFFNIFERSDSLRFTHYEHSHNAFVEKALATEQARWYMRFARHPWIQTLNNDDRHVVEFRDLQFSIDRVLLESVGMVERSTPFILRFVFAPDSTIAEITFDGKPLRTQTRE